MSDTPLVANNAAASKFEARTDAGLAHLTYVLEGDTIDLTHTYVPKTAEMRGVGSALVRAALEYARSNGLKVIPTCPFVRAFLDKHPEYQELRASI
jgi:predicted GNAT family acetyltransferase